MLLMLPRLLILLATMMGPRAAGFGGAGRVMLSALLETLLSSLMAPVFMALQSRAVAQILMGRDSGWPAADRDDGSIAFIEAAKFSGWVSASALAVMALISVQVPTIFAWSLPVLLPMLFSPLLVWLTAHAGLGQKLQHWGLFLTPAEVSPEPILTESALAREWLESATDLLDNPVTLAASDLRVPA
jgi:membrane glycosyltransferase